MVFPIPLEHPKRRKTVKPKRSRSHTVETDSLREFARLLPLEWVIRPHSSEDGLDDEVEIFEESGPSTGLMFFVQLKATEISRHELSAISSCSHAGPCSLA